MATKVLVTGATGFVGRSVVGRLVADPAYEVVYTYRSEPLHETKAKGIQLDLNDASAFAEYAHELAGISLVVHAAASVGPAGNDIYTDLDAHIVQTVVSLKNLMAHLPNVHRFVYVSSCSATIAEQDPGFYGLGKLLAEQVVQRLCQATSVEYVCMRFPQIYGPGEPHGTFVTRFIESLIRHQQIRLVNDGSVIRDIVYIEDVAGSIQQALGSDYQGVVTVCDPAERSVKDVLDELICTTGVNDPMVVSERRADSGLSIHFTTDAHKIGYSLQYDIEKGLRATVEAWKEAHVQG